MYSGNVFHGVCQLWIGRQVEVFLLKSVLGTLWAEKTLLITQVCYTHSITHPWDVCYALCKRLHTQACVIRCVTLCVILLCCQCSICVAGFAGMSRMPPTGFIHRTTPRLLPSPSQGMRQINDCASLPVGVVADTGHIMWLSGHRGGPYLQCPLRMSSCLNPGFQVFPKKRRI